MFKIFKKKENIELSLVAISDGKVIPLSEVPDPVFAEKMAGDGVAIDITSDTIVSPADGELTLIFETNHAFALTTKEGAELLVHIGIDTVSLNGDGFERLIEAGQKVKAGTPVIKIDRKKIKDKGLSLITPVLVTNPDAAESIEGIENIQCKTGETAVVKYKMK